MTNEEKIARGFYTTQFNVQTNETTQIVYTDEQVEETLNEVVTKSQPTKEELLAKLQDLQAQIAALTN